MKELFILLLATGLACTAAAAPLPRGDLERACWARYSGERTRVNLREPTAVEFANLRHGWRVHTPFTVDFAVRGMGVVPAGKVQAGTGHHHILVNTTLPPVFDKIPFSDRHRHFGKGQTSTLLELPPGRHRLRLLFADHDHRPHFVYTPEITVEVLGARKPGEAPRIDPARFDETCSAWYQEEMSRPRPPGEGVHIVNLRDGEAVTSPFVVRLGVDGWGVCAAGQNAEKSGVFALDILRDGRLVRTVDLSNGATQSNLSLPNGPHLLRLRFVDPASRRDLLPASETQVLVSGQERW